MQRDAVFLNIQSWTFILERFKIHNTTHCGQHACDHTVHLVISTIHCGRVGIHYIAHHLSEFHIVFDSEFHDSQIQRHNARILGI